MDLMISFLFIRLEFRKSLINDCSSIDVKLKTILSYYQDVNLVIGIRRYKALILIKVLTLSFGIGKISNIGFEQARKPTKDIF